MKSYIENLLPRLKQFSQNLDRKEIFVDTPWIIIDENNNRHKYIFRRDGSLIMSLNGEVQIGSWEYLSSAKSLLIDRLKDKILLNQYFVHPSIMVLRLDGLPDSTFILANELIIPDYDIKSFMQKFLFEKNNIRVINLLDGRIVELPNNSEIFDKQINVDGEKIEDCILEYPEENRKFEIRDGKIVRILFDRVCDTNKGKLIIEEDTNGVSIGNRVFFNNLPAPDGKYNIGFLDNLYILDGRLVTRSKYKQAYN